MHKGVNNVNVVARIMAVSLPEANETSTAKVHAASIHIVYRTLIESGDLVRNGLFGFSKTTAQHHMERLESSKNGLRVESEFWSC